MTRPCLEVCTYYILVIAYLCIDTEHRFPVYAPTYRLEMRLMETS